MWPFYKYKEPHKPILCVDFDGVIHSYTSGWHGILTVADAPVPGAMDFLRDALKDFDVYIFSARSNQWLGQYAMKKWLKRELRAKFFLDQPNAVKLFKQIKWCKTKPHAMIYLDDRAMCFTGEFPVVRELLNFKPWYK